MNLQAQNVDHTPSRSSRRHLNLWSTFLNLWFTFTVNLLLSAENILARLVFQSIWVYDPHFCVYDLHTPPCCRMQGLWPNLMIYMFDLMIYIFNFHVFVSLYIFVSSFLIFFLLSSFSGFTCWCPLCGSFQKTSEKCFFREMVRNNWMFFCCEVVFLFLYFALLSVRPKTPHPPPKRKQKKPGKG